MQFSDFSAEWESAWNAHDLDRILSHYDHDIVFRSTKAIALTGSGEVIGKPALRRYWASALAKQPDLHFRVQRVFQGHQMMVLTYQNHRGVSAAETLEFAPAGLVIRASACHSPD